MRNWFTAQVWGSLALKYQSGGFGFVISLLTKHYINLHHCWPLFISIFDLSGFSLFQYTLKIHLQNIFCQSWINAAVSRCGKNGTKCKKESRRVALDERWTYRIPSNPDVIGATPRIKTLSQHPIPLSGSGRLTTRTYTSHHFLCGFTK